VDEGGLEKYLPWFVFVGIAAILLAVFQQQQTRNPPREINFSELIAEVDQGHVHDVAMTGNEILGHFNDNRPFISYAPNDPTFVQKLEAKKVQISAKPSADSPGWLSSLLINGLPLVLFIGVWIYMSSDAGWRRRSRNGLWQVESQTLNGDAG